MTRHPEAVAAATSKWVDMDPAAMMDHWLDAYDIVRRDIDYLHAVITIRYEDLVTDPSVTLARLAAFLDVETVPAPSDIRDGNQEYAGTATLSPLKRSVRRRGDMVRACRFILGLA
ncbi:sulfotransferase [Sulfitobacter pontiacus]